MTPAAVPAIAPMGRSARASPVGVTMLRKTLDAVISMNHTQKEGRPLAPTTTAISATLSTNTNPIEVTATRWAPYRLMNQPTEKKPTACTTPPALNITAKRSARPYTRSKTGWELPNQTKKAAWVNVRATK